MRNRFYDKLAPDEAFRNAIHKENHTAGSTPKYREKGARQTAEKLLVNQYGWDKSELFKNWSNLERLYVGAFVFEVAARFGIVKGEKEKNNIKWNTYYELTEPIKAQAIKYQTALENRAIFKYPLLDIPKEWEQQTGASRLNTSGGYYQEWFKQDLKLCRDFLSDSKFGTDALKSLLTESGLGNHPEVIRFMYRAGKAISEDSYVGNSEGANAKGNVPKDFNGIANALYSNQQNK